MQFFAQLYEHLISTHGKAVDNKRLSIDLSALRQLIERSDISGAEFVDSTKGDYPRWIDTSVMLADPLTKVMSADVLERCFMTGYLDLKATEESLRIKARNRESRRSKSEAPKNEALGTESAH